MRLGFILGFILGGVASTLRGRPSVAEAPGEPAAGVEAIEQEAQRVKTEAQSFIDELKQTWREAIEAGKEAAREREEEMKREFEVASRNPGPPDPYRFRRR